MGEILPDGTIQSDYTAICPICKKSYHSNMQGQGSHDCITIEGLEHTKAYVSQLNSKGLLDSKTQFALYDAVNEKKKQIQKNA